MIKSESDGYRSVSQNVSGLYWRQECVRFEGLAGVNQ
jgi:hypothetical protein